MILAFLDVSSRSTNVPVDQTIEIILEYVHNNNRRCGDGISGWVLFAETYMAHIEDIVLQNMEPKPHMYCRYVDDIFVSVSTNEDLNTLGNRMQEISGLNFTIEYSINNRIPFLDVLVSNDEEYLNTTVYWKPTDSGKCRAQWQ